MSGPVGGGGDDRLVAPGFAISAPAGSILDRALRLHRSRAWTVLVVVAIVVNSVILGMLTAIPEEGPLFAACETIDELTLSILILDVLLTIFVKRLAVLRSGWDMFDISVTVVSLFPLLQALSALRAFRIVRIIRLLKFLPNGGAIINGIYAAMRSMTTMVVILGIVFYIFVVLCTTLFRGIDPIHFGDLGLTTISLYEVMVYYGADPEVMHLVTTEMPWSWLIFIPFIFLTSFAIFNMFIGLVTTAMETEMHKNEAEDGATLLRLETKVDALATRLDELLTRLQ